MNQAIKYFTLCFMMVMFSVCFQNIRVEAAELDDQLDIYYESYMDVDLYTQIMASLYEADYQETETVDIIDISEDMYVQEDTDDLEEQNIYEEPQIDSQVIMIPQEPVEEEYTIKTFTITAYCTCSKCCGHSSGVTASGKKATAWHTVATGGKYEFGTKLYIPELEDTPSGGWFEIEDRGSKVNNNKLDLCLSDHEEAKSFGTKRLEVYIY